MEDSFAPITHLLDEVILPNLKAVQASQMEQVAANDQLEQAIEDLQAHIRSQFLLLNAQLTACRIEIAALKAALEVAESQNGLLGIEHPTLIH